MTMLVLKLLHLEIIIRHDEAENIKSKIAEADIFCNKAVVDTTDTDIKIPKHKLLTRVTNVECLLLAGLNSNVTISVTDEVAKTGIVSSS